MNEPDQLQYAQVGVRGPGLPEWYWAKMSGLSKQLRALPLNVRAAIGYVGEKEQGRQTEPVAGVYFVLSISYYKRVEEKKFDTVQELLTFLDANPRVADFLEYKRKP